MMICLLLYSLRTIGAVVHGGSTIFCSGSPVGCMKPWKFQVGYSEIGCEVRQFYLNVSILFVLLLSIQVNVIKPQSHRMAVEIRYSAVERG